MIAPFILVIGLGISAAATILMATTKPVKNFDSWQAFANKLVSDNRKGMSILLLGFIVQISGIFFSFLQI